MKNFFLFLLIFLSVHCLAQSKDERAIRKLLNGQTIAWNKGDLEGFMTGYWKNDSLMFIGKSGITYGWTNTLNNYKKGYPDTAAMGKLSFDIITVKRINKKYFQVVGKWHLQRTMGDLRGHYTLLMKKIDGQWVIISDHSS